MSAAGPDDATVDAGLTRPARSRGREDSEHHAGSPYTGRFRSATAVLVGFAIGAVLIAGAVAISGRNNRQTPQIQWSQWSPTASGTLGARQIADYIAPFYRLSSVDQLAVVTVVNLESAGAAAAAQAAAAQGIATTAPSGLQVAVRPSPASSSVALLSGNTIAYNLCGIGGSNCAIGVGTPSANRLLLLRREALELALYTFRYIPSTDNVVAILPPGKTVETSTLSKSLPTSNAPVSKPVNIAVLFERSELAPLLQVPLRATLPEQTPPTVSEMSNAPEAGLVETVTARGLFSEELQQAQDGSQLIVLNPLPAQ